MSPRRRLLFWVQHLLGVGHLRRAAALTRALEHVFDVTVVSGGLPVRDLDLGRATLEQLPPVRAADASFARLVDGDGRNAGRALWRARRDRLLALHAALAPDIVLTEMFPFGRRPFRFELEPLLDVARARTPPPQIACSVRDILTESRTPGRYDEMAERAIRWYDAVLVHADPAVITLDATFPAYAAIADRVRHTGYVVDAPAEVAPPAPDGDAAEILISVGGGAVGADLLEAASGARQISALGARTWRLLAGDKLPAPLFERVKAAAGPGTVVERARADFSTLLARAAVSVSQAGYNTVTDLLQARVPTVLVPFAREGETEQTTRARRLEALGLARVVPEEVLSATTLARAIDAAWRDGAPRGRAVDLQGAATTTRLLAEMVGA